MGSILKNQISEFPIKMFGSMGVIEYLNKNNSSKGSVEYDIEQQNKITLKRMDAIEYLKTKINTLETFDL